MRTDLGVGIQIWDLLARNALVTSSFAQRPIRRDAGTNGKPVRGGARCVDCNRMADRKHKPNMKTRTRQ